VIVRRRLVQKMEFLLRALADVPEPDDAELEAWIEAHPERYDRPARVRIEHRFFSRDRRSDSEGDARAALAALRAGDRSAAEGDPFPAGLRFGPIGRERLAEQLSPAAAATAFGASDDAWRGPVESAWGSHLVRVLERVEGGSLGLDDARERARHDYVEAARDQELERAVAELVTERTGR
jgi:parvulin-like peptidyl-prolyl isomerase